ncbi:homeobox protein prospero isoform X2 [Drosophila navojoa]|uniref:homeobox protein prospero isoform X2 n=1 Tax=Drosophila navojoa TaxID=7232 RepID=UPI0011BEF89D|nr:homeobox protein prospero isoform X2 [Drosophila navojoa]
MFNLLRRTRQRKAHKSNKNYDASDEEEGIQTKITTTASAAAAARTREQESSNASENRCLFSARERDAERARESEQKSAMRLPTQAARRAVIEELEDLSSDEHDEERQSVNLAKTAAATATTTTSANGHSAISWRSDNLNINNMGAGNGATTARTTSVVVDDDDDVDVDRNGGDAAAAAAAVGHGGATSPNESASANAKANNVDGRPIGIISTSSGQTKTRHNNGPITDGTVIDATDTVIYRSPSKQSNELKRQSRLSLGNFALHLGGNRDNIDTAADDTAVQKKRKALQKSRDFLTDIFMARGRNHQRQQRNQQQQQQQKHQQQQQHQSKSKTSIDDNVIAIGQTLAAAHLETNSDPATASTNSYQMTMSNNSPQLWQRAAKERERELEREQQQQQQQQQQQERERERERNDSNSAGALRQEQQAKESRQLAREEQQQRRDAHRAASANFIQAANVELCTVAEDQQEDAAVLQRSNSSSSSISSSNNTTGNNNTSDIISGNMGQTSTKPNECTQSAHSSRASTPREFRESIVSEPQSVPVAPPRHQKQQTQQEVPKITVSDCSFEQSPTGSPLAGEVFYDFESQSPNQGHSQGHDLNIQELNEAHEETLEDEVFDIPTTIYQQQANGIPRPWTRLTNVKLENVQEEDEDDPQAEPEPEDDELDEAVDLECDDRGRGTPNSSRKSASSERSALKSDSNLSSSYADSGIGMGLGVAANESTSQADQKQQQQPVQRSAASMQPRRTPFVRDGNSTSTDCDCEELLLQCDELDDEQQFDERLVCIESISLPDVVVESTTVTSQANASSSSSSSSSANNNNSSSSNGNNGEGHLNINITNGAGGNSLGNVHFIPIHIEGSGAAARSRSNSPNQRSLDDSCIGRNTVEIVEDDTVLNNQADNNREALELRKELKVQKARFSSQLEDAHKNVQNLESKVSDMQLKIQNLEQELSQKQWNVDRLQGELTAAQKDDEYVRKKLKLLEDEKVHLRHKYSDDEDEFRRKYNTLEAQYNELTEKYKQTQSLANGLQTQLAAAQAELAKWADEVNRIREELEEQIRILKNALENSEAERKICEDKWQTEFELLRTHNREREETLMSDCEWQMRQMQRQWKDKLDKSNYERKQAAAKAEELELELQSRRKEAESLRICQAQVKSLSGVVSEQERSIQTLMERIDNLKDELEMANSNLETQIEAVHKIKYQCDNAIYDKERQMIYRIDEVRNEAAAFWENKLYTEMTRLTNELESVYVEERRDALDKLQAEHIEELRALTNRYTANEEELRAEIEELTENLELKKQDFLSLRERSDNALLQTRMHLDRADREYQNAMCREEDRRVELEEKLRKEFEAEKEEMEEKFRERLDQVKEEFAKELQLSTQDMIETHRKELESQKAKLQSERDEAIQELVERHRAKLAAAEERINDVELRHQRNLKDLKAAYDAEKAALDKRDISNANEIEQLHRKCRCLTNLFEEMRMRYERRDPRPEDLREIAELRQRCDSQERDLFVLTDRLRDMQNQMAEQQQQQQQQRGNAVKKPPPKTLATSCDVIYEENEERESPELEVNGNGSASSSSQDDGDEEEPGEQEPSDTESNHTIEINGKCKDLINENDAHMISAV